LEAQRKETDLKHAPARFAAAAVSALAFAVATATIPVYADANPNNEGHHYGQLKHPKTQPVPSPLPAPSPVPTTNPPSTIVPTTIVPAVTAIIAGGSNHGASSSDLASQLPLTAPTQIANPREGSVRTSPAQPTPLDSLWWLVLLILPALVATWLMSFRGLAARALADRAPAAWSRPEPAVAELIPSPQP
jgi:hypothetical protein